MESFGYVRVALVVEIGDSFEANLDNESAYLFSRIVEHLGADSSVSI